MSAFTLSVTVRNRPGVLAAVSGLIAGCGANIERMKVGQGRDPGVSRMKIAASVGDEGMETLVGQMAGLQDVLQFKAAKSRAASFAYWTVAYGLFVTILGVNAAAPLYSIYKSLWGLTPVMITFVFAAYAFLVIPSIVLFGRWSDRFGPKIILVPGLLTALAGTVGLAAAGGLSGLLAARALQGLSVGMFNGVAVAAMTSLHRNGNRRQAAILAAAAVTAGNAAGPVLTGVLAEWAPYPTVLPFAVHALLILPGLAALMGARWKRESDANERKVKVRMPKSARKPFAVAAATSMAAWTAVSLFMSVIPTFLNEWIGKTSFILSGFMIALVLAVSAAGQFGLRKQVSSRAMTAGFVLLSAGMTGVALTIHIQSPALLFVSAFLVGIGHGPMYAGSLAAVNLLVPDGTRGDMVSWFYVVTYIGVAFPILGLGYAAQRFGFAPAVDGYAAVLIIFSALCIIGWHRTNKWRVPD